MKIFTTKMMSKISTFLLIIFMTGAVAIMPNSALADSVKSNTINAVEQAASKVVKDTGVKEQFGQSEKGDRLFDKAQNRASEKLKQMAQEAKSDGEMPDSKKLFMDNLTDTE